MKKASRANVTVSACGIFAEPTFKSEMVSQAVLDEEVIISEKKDDWYKVELQHDGYIGWIHDMYLEENRQNFNSEEIHNRFLKNPIVSQAYRMLGKPYLWGGRSFQGYDCSGLVQTSLNCCGIEFPRDARDQVKSDLLHEVEIKNTSTGDLLFFEDQKIVNHVAIVVTSKHLINKKKYCLKIIHASGSVKISEIIFDSSFYGVVDGRQNKRIKLYKIMRLKENV
jgi:hypothetical protein